MTLVVRPHRSNLVRWAQDREDVLVLSADLTASCEADLFRDTFPGRFLSLGMAEQNMMSFAAGLCREGLSPFVHTFAVFICRRPFDQVAMSIGYPNLPVRLLGFLPGITTPGGVTHQAIDDVALMGAIPNMTVLSCGDATDVESVLDATLTIDGPCYVRMLRGEVPRLFDAREPLRVGRSRKLGDGTDITILSEGICTEEAMRAALALRARGLSIEHVHVSSLVPFGDDTIREALQKPRYGVITLENHLVRGGLGSAVAETLAEAGSGRRLVRLGLQNTYAHGASRAYLMRKYGIDAVAVARAAQALVGERLGIGPDDLAVPVAPPTAAAGDSRVEDL